jgi:protein phosphatase methylesterase 1
LLARDLAAMTDCALVAVDLRGHGETEVEGEEADLSGPTMVEDVQAVVAALQAEGAAGGGVVLVGHSMGGALAALAAEAGVAGLVGLVVVDVVEGTALEALAGMQAVLRYIKPRDRSNVEPT